jgi:hypothetical protein
MKSREKRAETHTSFDMSRKSKAKDQTKALNIPFTFGFPNSQIHSLIAIPFRQFGISSTS